MNLIFITGAILSLIGIYGEHLSDVQLKDHLKTNLGKTLQTGFWRYSRHPNYFFEWIFWVGTATMCLQSPYAYLGLLAPFFMYIFLNYFTGVAISEAGASQRRADFKEYQNKTSAFFLCPPRKR